MYAQLDYVLAKNVPLWCRYEIRVCFSLSRKGIFFQGLHGGSFPGLSMTLVISCLLKKRETEKIILLASDK